MSTYEERKVSRIEHLLKSRTRKDGSPKPGYESVVASLRAELKELRPEGENG